MHLLVIGLLFMQSAKLACGTCVLASDFGFILDCNFKKSGLFRVRNLGGLKAHFGLGFSLGDELGFAESLGNLEGGRRRAISYKNGAPPELIGVLPSSQQDAGTSAKNVLEKRISSRSTSVLPLPAQTNMELLQQVIHQRAIEAPQAQLMTEARPLPLGVPAFRPIPQNPIAANSAAAPAQAQRRISVEGQKPRISVNNKLIESNAKPHSNRTFHADSPVVSAPVAVPVFQAMPDSISRIAAATKLTKEPKYPKVSKMEEPKFDLKDVTVEELASAANVSVETIKHAIYVREQQLKAEHRAMLAAKLREEFTRTSTTRTTTTTSTTTAKPIYIETPQESAQMISKVMNAPKEYYPASYDKNFDDNFKSKVDLPATSFSCIKQKHFPGLYADTDLGCMVFHVCALTDDGMVRKSFLCPENTIFDQTILKCNWWFYVDCSSSMSVYDSNIPISKSYQLMKSLTYFSKYNRQKGDNDDIKNENDLLKNALPESIQGKAFRETQSKEANLNESQPDP